MRIIFLASLASLVTVPAWAQSTSLANKLTITTDIEDEMIVEGLYNGELLAVNTPASIDVIGRERLVLISPVHPSEALNTVAGVNIQRGSGQEHLTAIRSPVLTSGAGAGSFLYLEDGVPLRAAGFSNVNGLFEAGTEFAGQLEAFKGPGPVRYGSNAVHGLINVQSRHIEGPNTIRILGSDDGLLSGVASAAIGNLRASVSAVHDNGFRADSGFDQQKIQLKHFAQLGGWTVDSLASFNNLNQETAGFIQGDDVFEDREIAASNPNPEAFRDGKSYRLQARFERELAGNTLALTPFARRAELRFLRHFVPGQALEKNGHTSVGLQSAYYGEGFNVGVDLEYTDGFLFEFQDNPDAFSFVQGLHYDYKVRSIVGAAYAEKDFLVTPNTVFQIGARAEYTHYDYDNNASDGTSGRFIRTADRTDDFFFVTPKASLTHYLDKGIVYARAARGSRAPQVADLYSLQLNQLAGENEVETLDSLEAGYKYEGDRISFEFAGFAMWKDNFFFRNANGFNVTDGKTNHIGIEGSLIFPLTNWLTFSADGTLAKHTYDFTLDEGTPANNITNGDRVDTAPDTLGTVRLTATPSEAVLTEIELRHVGDYFTNPGNTNSYDGHNIFIGRVTYALSDVLKINGRVDNIFDTRFADRADFAFGNERFFPGRPRTVFFGISAEF